MTETKLNTTREEATKHLGVLNQYANGGTTGEYPFAARVIQDRLDLEDELARVREELALTQRTGERLVFERDKLRERLEAAEKLVPAVIRLYRAWDKDWPHTNKMLEAGKLAQDYHQHFGGSDE